MFFDYMNENQKQTLETLLHDYLKSRGGKHIKYEEIKYMVEKVWMTPDHGRYRMTTLERRARADHSKETDISQRIGKDIDPKTKAITAFYYKTDSLIAQDLNCSLSTPCYSKQKFGVCEHEKQQVSLSGNKLF